MSVGLNRASIYAVKKEVAPGEYLEPTAGKEFLPLRPGNELSYEPETLENDEVLNDIGAAKAFIGKEVVSGKHSAYLKHSGVEGVEPQSGLLYESMMGQKAIQATEHQTDAGSTVAQIALPAGKGVEKRVGEAVLVKDGTNGYSIRNITKIVGDVAHLNFNLPAAPAAGINLGKAVTYIPAAQGHPTFSTTKYLGNGFGKECSAGNTVTEVSIKADANGFGEVEFSFEGTKYFFNPIIVTASNKHLDVTDDSGVVAISIPEGVYKTPIELADALNASANDTSTENYKISYNSNTGKFEISSESTVLEILGATGVNTANSILPSLGYTKTDKTGATSYVSEAELNYAATVTPDFDNVDGIIIKGAELLIGNATDNQCICAQSVAITISKEVEDVDCICEETGIKEKIPTSRSVEMEVTAIMKKHDASLLDALLKNKGVSAMLNAGPKVGGNYVAGKCFNAYLQTATVSKYTTTGDSFIQVNLTLKGYVSSLSKDIYINFV